jgi:hypothetical protein
MRPENDARELSDRLYMTAVPCARLLGMLAQRFGFSPEQVLLNEVGCEARKTPAVGDVFFLDFYLYRTYQDIPGLLPGRMAVKLSLVFGWGRRLPPLSTCVSTPRTRS